MPPPVYSNLIGIIGNFFRLGLSGNALKNRADGVEVRKFDDSDKANLSAARPTVDDHVVTFLDLKERALILEGGFSGLLPNFHGYSGKYLMCHTTGGIYIAGTVYLVHLDEHGATPIPLYKGIIATTSVGFTGTITMDVDTIYMEESEGPPYAWGAKGGHGGSGGDTYQVKTDATDHAPGYLGDKIDPATLAADAVTKLIKVKDDVFVHLAGSETLTGVKSFIAGLRTDGLASVTLPAYDMVFDAGFRRWRFRVKKGVGGVNAVWSWDVDESGDLMPFEEDAP